ncbi:hypothetical protein, partial [Vibrio cincinnatiensis]|uniref:hypothetical protein n=1 Tax=Vibrio cincinnatiensis TaxID=675 RepID=UPI001EDF7466
SVPVLLGTIKTDHSLKVMSENWGPLLNLTVEYEALAAGFSVAILPIFYAFGASLLLLPLIVQD